VPAQLDPVAANPACLPRIEAAWPWAQAVGFAAPPRTELTLMNCGDTLFQCTLPIPPSVNNLFVNARGRGRYPSKKYTAWKKAALAAFLPKRPNAVIERPIEIVIRMSTKCRSDLDNIAKAPIDFLVQNGVIQNDNRAIVKRIVLEWDASITGAAISILAR